MSKPPIEPYCRCGCVRKRRGLRRLDTLSLNPQPEATDNHRVFLAGIGWRTGSTLMQRILMTDPSLLMWGEPMGQAQIVSRITDSLSGITDLWPAASQFYSHRPEVDLTGDWVANLGPDSGYLKAGMRGLCDAWLAKPAHTTGDLNAGGSRRSVGWARTD